MYNIIIEDKIFEVSGSEAAYAEYEMATRFAEAFGFYCALTIAETGTIIDDNTGI